MKPKIAFLVLFLISSLFLFSEAILWNGHYYEAILVTGGLNFDQANAAATSKGGYLVSITSIVDQARGAIQCISSLPGKLEKL